MAQAKERQTVARLNRPETEPTSARQRGVQSCIMLHACTISAERSKAVTGMDKTVAAALMSMSLWGTYWKSPEYKT